MKHEIQNMKNQRKRAVARHFSCWVFIAHISFLLTACAPERSSCGKPAEKLRGREVTRVLFIGNSFTMGVPAAFRQEAARRGKLVETGVSAHDGWSLLRHSRDAETRRLLQGSWDIVAFQERSDRPGKWWERNCFMIPALGSMVRMAADHGAVPVLYQTWGYGKNPTRMAQKVAHGCDIAAEKLGGITVIRVGDAWARNGSPNLFRADAKHPTAYGNQVTARAFCDAFWGTRLAQ